MESSGGAVVWTGPDDVR